MPRQDLLAKRAICRTDTEFNMPLRPARGECKHVPYHQSVLRCQAHSSAATFAPWGRHGGTTVHAPALLQSYIAL